MDIEEKTVFSSNGPLLLGSFWCSGIKFCKSNHRDLRSYLSVEVEITEAQKLKDPNAKVLLNLKANLNSDVTSVSLSQPIFIRPNHFYTICIKRFPDEHFTSSAFLQRSVVLKSDIEINFHNDEIVNDEAISLIWMLQFNRI